MAHEGRKLIGAHITPDVDALLTAACVQRRETKAAYLRHAMRERLARDGFAVERTAEPSTRRED